MNYLDRWTHYRRKADIEREFARHFVNPSRLEAQWLLHKFDHASFARAIPATARQGVTLLLAGLVFQCEKPCAEINSVGDAKGLPAAPAG